ncbi:MAG: ATP-binding protein [Bacteroidia bacterium]|nr:ATP-binding protein [Bacteroidia bacterium]
MRPQSRYAYFLFLIFLASLGRSFAQEIFPLHALEAGKDKYPLEKFLSVLPDPAGMISFQEAVQSSDFLPLDQLKKEKTTQAVWVALELEVSELRKEAKDWFLIFHPYNTKIEIHVEKEGSWESYLQGAHVPYRDRSYISPSNMSPAVQKISLPERGSMKILAKIYDIHDSHFPFLELELSKPEVFESNVTIVRMFSTFIIGGVILMIIMVIILNIYLGHTSHFYYLLYLLTLLFVEGLTAGADTLYIPNYVGVLWEWMEPWFFPDHPEYRFYFEVRWYILIVVYFLFIRSYLELDKLLPKWDKIMKGLIYLGLGATFLGLYVLHSSNLDILVHDDFLAAYVGLFFLSVIVFLFYLKKTGDKRAIFVIAGFTAIILSSSPTLINIIISDSPSGYADSYLIIGLFVEKIIFTAAISFRQKRIEKQLYRRKEDQKRLLEEQNKMLEEAVESRTAELLEKTNALEEALIKQKITQSKLVEQEKMASIGQLTAGIAHEINNPINFVSSNIDSLWLDLKDIKIMLEKIEKLAIEHDDEELAEKIKKLIKESDASFLFKEMIGLVEGIQYGAERTQEIVKGLRNFSRLDEDVFKRANLQEGIESTLRILKVQIGRKIELVKEYGEIPLVCCLPGKLNQVFMNILSNGIQALGGEGKIHIQTYQEGEDVIVKISDNGKGMSEEVQKRIFEPFYTTKDVGEGTGLGMYIVHGIIEQHKGSITVSSEMGKGSEFRIRIPIDS